MLKVAKLAFEPVKVVLKESDPSGETYVIIRPATMEEEARRFQLLMDSAGPLLNTRVLAVELYLTLEECNIQFEDGTPVLDPEQDFDTFSTNLTAIWRAQPTAVRELQEAVYAANPHWGPDDAGNG